MERIQETFRISWQENKETKTIEDLDKKTKENVGFLVKIVEKIKKNFGIPAKKTRKPRTSMILTKQPRKLLDFLPRKFFLFLRFLAKIFAIIFDKVGKFLQDRGENPRNFSEFLAKKQENQDYLRS